MRGRLIGPKTWDRVVGILNLVLDSVVTVWTARGVFYAINCVLCV